MKIYILEKAYLEIDGISLSLFVPEPNDTGGFQAHNGYAIYLEEYQEDFSNEVSQFLKEMSLDYSRVDLYTTAKFN